MTYDMNCETMRGRIDAFVDGELDGSGRAALEAHCARCADCARELRAAACMRDALHELPVLTAPAHVIESAHRTAASTLRVVPPMPARHARHRLLPAIAAALAVTAAVVWLVSERRAGSTPAYSDAEIRRASTEMALAFAYVDRYSLEAAGIVSDDVLGRRVVPRIERALTASGDAAIHDALVPGLKRAVRASGLNVTSPAPERS